MLKQQLNLTVAIVRSFNFAGIGEFVQKLLDFGIGHVVVVVPKDQDYGVTAPLLRPFNLSRVHLVEQSFKHGGRAWSAMLNAGLDYIENNFGDDFIDYVLTVSNTVLLERRHLEFLYEEMDWPNVMVTGARFRGVGKDGEEVSLGKSYNYHFRNTLALYRAEAFRLHSVLRRFDETLDGASGMEDLLWKRLLQGYTNHRVVEDVMEVPLLVYTHRTPAQQAEYEALLEEGMKAAEFRAEHLLFLDR